MAAGYLIFKRRNGKSEFKIIPSMRNGHGHENCHQEINLSNYRDIALWFEDLRSVWNVPIDKAIAEYQKNKGNWLF